MGLALIVLPQHEDLRVGRLAVEALLSPETEAVSAK
jgi:hypothetical protein